MFKRYLNNTIANTILQIVSIITGLILPILVLKAYGSVLNGLLNSVKQIVGYLSIVEAGIGAVSIAALYKPLTEKDNKQISGIVSAARIFYNRSGLVFCSLVVLLALIFPFIVKSQVNSIYTILMVLIVGIGGTLEFFIIGKYKVLLTSDQREYVVLNIQSIGLLLNMTLTVLIVKLGFNLIVVQAGAALVYLLRAFAIKRYVHWRYKEIVFDALPNNEKISQRWDALIHQIAALVVFNTDILLLTIFSTLKEVSVYSIYRLIFTAIGQIPAIFSAGVQPALGKMNSSYTKEKFEKTYSQFEMMYYMMIAFVYSACFVLFMSFISIYTRGITDANYIRPKIMILFLLGDLLSKIRFPSNMLVNINGLFKQTKNRAIIEAAINLLVSLMLVKKFGMAGVLFGTICSYLYRTTDFIIYASKLILHRTIWKSLRLIITNVVFAILAIYTAKLSLTRVPTTYVQWSLNAVMVSGIILLIVGIGNVLCNWNAFKLTYNYVGKMFNRKFNN